MRHTDLSSFENLPYFTIQGFLQMAGEEIGDNAHARVALHRWANAGYLIPLKKGVYMHRSFYERHRPEVAFSALVSSILLPQSYLSLEYVLQQRDILSVVTYPITAVTIKNTRTISNRCSDFVYRHIQPSLYYGFRMAEAYGIPYSQASPAKALFDYLYLRPVPGRLTSPHYDLAEELRLNLDEFSSEEREEFAEFVRASGLPKMQDVLKNLEQHIWRR
jgi:hypothetical protein